MQHVVFGICGEKREPAKFVASLFGPIFTAVLDSLVEKVLILAYGTEVIEFLVVGVVRLFAPHSIGSVILSCVVTKSILL